MPLLILPFILALALLFPACQREEKVVYYKPFFTGLPGVETQTPAVLGPGQSVQGDVPVEDVSKFSLVKENPDGSKTLISKNGQHLMMHIQQTLADNDAKTFASQVLSRITRNEFRDRGLDPAESFKMLKPHEKDIAKLFARMPLGEHSPNVVMDPIGDNMFRIQVTGRSRDDLYWTGFDMSLEKGNWRLRWFVK